MIDNQDQVERLLGRLTEVMPLPALASPPLIANLRGRSSAAKITPECRVAKAFYTGDEGGVMCQVIFDEDEAEQVFLVSITHLAFDRSLPVAREIAAYQTHRIKGILRENAGDAPAAYH